jgi:hypothetical protein
LIFDHTAAAPARAYSMTGALHVERIAVAGIAVANDGKAGDGAATAPQAVSISANEIRPVSGNPSRTADTAKPLMKATWYPASAMSFVTTHRTAGMIYRPARRAQTLSWLTQSLLQASGEAMPAAFTAATNISRSDANRRRPPALAAGNNPELGQVVPLRVTSTRR